MASIFERLKGALLGKAALPPTDKAIGYNATLDKALELGHGRPAKGRPSDLHRYQQTIRDARADLDEGSFERAASIAKSCYTDGVFNGVMSCRTAGLVSLPKRFRGDPEICSWLSSGYAGVDGSSDDPRAVFDLICPPSELSAIAADGIMLGVGVGMLVEYPGLDFPLFQRVDPAPLKYLEPQNLWVYNSYTGPIPITPGVGPLILYTPGGRSRPWDRGIWQACGGATTRIEHAQLHLDSWLRRFADAARVATAPVGASEDSIEVMQQALIDWGNSSVVMKEGWDLKLLAISGDGAKIFTDLIASVREELIITVCGQTVTTDGGTGFANADIHKAIRGDLIRDTAQALAEMVNSQIIPAVTAKKFGDDALWSRYCFVNWDTEPPKDMAARAQALTQLGTAVQTLTGKNVSDVVNIDVHALAKDFGLPMIEPSANGAANLLLVDGGKE